MKIKNEEPSHAKRRGWLKNGNIPGDFSKAPRCGAKTRKGTPCCSPAMKNGRCRMHGGTNPGGPFGNQYALKDGFWTKKAIADRKMVRQILRESRKLLEEF
ncbi:MAG: HGGxSTG domain-containing protein [Thermodesulfobacteriota bacterium]|nr:HGGxSTG domain-containing protein [Thermodesulfobacteriota bacterium]